MSHTGAEGTGTIYVPNSKSTTVDDYWSFHRGGCNHLFADGSGRLIKKFMKPNIFSYLSTWAGGEVNSADQF